MNKKILISIIVLSTLGFLLLITLIAQKNINWTAYDAGDYAKNINNKNLILHYSFTAKENYLGTILIRFKQENYPYKNTVIFRIREEKTKKWFYEGSYDTYQFGQLSLFPFGFPTIVNSKDKNYLVEIQYSANSQYLVSISKGNPNIYIRYQIPKKILIHDKNKALLFIREKFIFIFQNTNIILNLSITFLPLILYFLFLFFRKTKILNLLFEHLLKLYPLSICISIFLIVTESIFNFKIDFIKIIIFLFLVYINKRIDNRKKVIFKTIPVIAIIALFFFFTKLNETAYNLAEWIYYFFWIVIVLSFLEFLYFKKS